MGFKLLLLSYLFTCKYMEMDIYILFNNEANLQIYNLLFLVEFLRTTQNIDYHKKLKYYLLSKARLVYERARLLKYFYKF